MDAEGERTFVANICCDDPFSDQAYDPKDRSFGLRMICNSREVAGVFASLP